MKSNPVLEKLGYGSHDRVVIFHADDIGMCQASVSAYHELLLHSPLSSAAVMVPCPWFPSAAELIRSQHDQPKLDVGVHLTVTSEWDVLRWGPLSTTAVSSGLIDEEGYFYRASEPVQTNATLEAISAEIEAQITRAISAGVTPTHVDSHMGTLFHDRFFPLYVQVAEKHGLPFLGLRVDVEAYVARGFERETAVKLAATATQLEEQGFPLFDSIQMMPLVDTFEPQARLDHAVHIINSLPAGLHYFIIHPAKESPELRALTDYWPARVGDYELFIDKKWHTAVDASGIKVIGFNALKALLQ